jgi:pilus assembly protein CpaF
MFTILIQEKGGEQRRMVFNKPEVTIGRVQGNDIVLPKGNVSKRHARIVLKDGKFIIVDLKSTNGTYVNGRKITSPLVVKDSDKIYIGDFIVGVDEAGGDDLDRPSETNTSPPQMAPPPDLRPPRPTEAQPMAPHMIPGGNADPIAPIPRSQPPRPAPSPTRDMPAAREPAPPMGARERDPEPRSMPPIAPPSARPAVGRPAGGTMPPPLSPIPSPLAAPPPVVPATPAPMPSPIASPLPMAPMAAPAPTPMPAPMPAPAPMPVPMSTPTPVSASLAEPIAPAPAPTSIGAPAPVVPLADKNNKARNLVGQGAKRVVGRAVATPGRRGLQLEPLDAKTTKLLDLQANILERLRVKLDLDKIPLERLQEEDLWDRVQNATISMVEALETSGELPKYIEHQTLIDETLKEALALGPLEHLLADETIDEIIIDRRDRIVVGKDGQLRSSGRAFSSDDVFERVVKRLVASEGGRIDETTPIIDLRMHDGTRLTAAISPVAVHGATLVLKKAKSVMPTLADLGARGGMSTGMANFLATCITARRNILVCGAAGSGKTHVLAALAAASPQGERVVSIEEVGELSLARDEWVALETRVGVGKNAEVDMQALLETALRLLPDRLIVGEVRGREALSLIQALNASTDGAVVAMTGEGANTALNRLATLARSAGGQHEAVRELAAQAFEIVVHVSRWTDGSLRVTSIEEVVGCSETGFDTQLLFQFQNGSFSAAGHVPRFYSELEARGIPADQAVFR